MQRKPMRQRLVGILRSRVFITLLLAFLIVSLGGAAYEIKSSYIPGPVSAMQRYDEPINGYSSHADFERECLHCHAPVRCLSANLCQDCHRDVARERAEAEGLHGLLPGTEKCQNCHGEHRGRDAAIVDLPLGAINHEQLAGYVLEQHENDFDGTPLTCQSCHPDGMGGAASVSCAACHAGEDPELMAAHTEEYGEMCVPCHDGQDRMIDGFDHEESYALDGAHLDVECRECHADGAIADAVRDCADCHEEPEVHAGETGLHCDWCHTAVAWTPAQLTVHVFRLDHGGGDEEDCEICHTGTYVTYTCYECHDHQPAEMEAFHTREGIDRLEPCDECHPTGVEGEAGEAGHGG